MNVPQEATALVAHLCRQALTVAVAESLTGGALCARFVDVPGASTVLRGGVVSYATQLKASILGVDADLLAQRGAVDPQVAIAMAVGVRRLCGADHALATTGVAGPDPADGQPVGRVYLGWAGPQGATCSVRLDLAGDRQQIREQTVQQALALLARMLSAGELTKIT